MKITKTLTAALMASTVLLGATACSGGEKASDTPQVEQTVDTVAQDKKDIAETVDGFYAYIVDSENIDKLANDFGIIQESKGVEITNDDEMAKAIKDSSPEAFVFFDAYDKQTIANSYSFIVSMALRNETDDNVVYSTPEEAISVDGDTAVVDQSMVETSGGEENKSANGPYYDEPDEKIDLIKKDGKWLVKAHAINMETGERADK